MSKVAKKTVRSARGLQAMSGASKPKFSVWQVVAYKSENGKWEVDRIAKIEAPNGEYPEMARLERELCRIETRYLRPLTARERGPSTTGKA